MEAESEKQSSYGGLGPREEPHYLYNLLGLATSPPSGTDLVIYHGSQALSLVFRHLVNSLANLSPMYGGFLIRKTLFSLGIFNSIRLPSLKTGPKHLTGIIIHWHCGRTGSRRTCG